MASAYTTLHTEADILSSLAFADARHDFGPQLAANFFAILQESLPGHVSWIQGENAALELATQISGNRLIPAPYNNANALFLALGGSSDTPIAIVCDSSFGAGIMRLLQRNTIGTVYFIQNREVYNDPGNNPGILQNVLRDAHSVNINYPAYRVIDTNINSKLCSTFEVVMSLNDVVYTHGEYTKSIKYTDNYSLDKVKRKIGHHNFGNIHTIQYQDPEIIKSTQCLFLHKRCGD